MSLWGNLYIKGENVAMKGQKNELQAVVLAGGFGTRLSPITDSKPKPLVRIFDTTVLENVLCMLNKTEAAIVSVSTFYKSEMIEEVCRRVSRDICCKRETTALGTAGGVKNCYDGKSENVLVVSGDGVFDFDLQKAVDFHVENKNDVTIVTSRKHDPTEYGVVLCDDDGNITEFSEKPCWSRVKSNLVNTGIYVLSKKVLDSIPDNMKYDFSNNLFPKLLSESAKMRVFEYDGFWCDIGTFDEYYSCMRLALCGKINLCKLGGENIKKLVEKGIHAEENVYVSKNASIGKNVRIADMSVVCNGAQIHDDCDVSGAVVGSGCILGKGTSITGAILGDNVIVGENCVIPEGCVIADGCRIEEGTVLHKQRRIKPGLYVSKGDKMSVGFTERKCVFVSDGVAVMNRTAVFFHVPDFARAVSLAYKKSEKRCARVGVMTHENIRPLKELFVSGLECENSTVFDFGEGNKAMCRYACSLNLADVCVLISADDKKVYFTFFSENCDFINNTDERKILKLFDSLGEKNDMVAMHNECGQIINVPVREMYRMSLLTSTEKILSGIGFSGLELCLKEDRQDSYFLKNVIETLGARILAFSADGRMTAELVNDGQGVKVECDDAVLDSDHVAAVVLKNSDILGLVHLKYTEKIPCSLKSIIKKNGNYISQTEDVMSGFLCDGNATLLLLMCVMALKGETLKSLSEQIPRFEVFTDEYIADVNRGETMERLSRLYNNSKDADGDGIHLSLAQGDVTVIPNRAKGFKIIAEAQSMEAAKELCFKIGEAIKN